MSEAATSSTAPARGRGLPFGWLAYIGAAGSILACYGTPLLVTVFAGVGFFSWNPHVQAVLMWLLGMLAVYGLHQDRRQHGHPLPMATGSLGVVIIIATLYSYYNTAIEVTGYVLLVAAAFLNQNIMLRRLNVEVEGLRRGLERRVADQVAEIERLARLRRFLAPEVARLITAEQEESLLGTHRSYIAALFCDLRGFTTFSDSMEPEEVGGVLESYHQRVGELISKHAGTIDHRAGDGVMVFFNDPLPCEQPVLRAVELALAIRDAFAVMNTEWRRRGYELGLGIGIASGYCTVGTVGFEDRFDYTANGNAVNMAARLCAEAGDGQILISQKAWTEVEQQVRVEPVGELCLRGFARPTPTSNVLGLVDLDEQRKDPAAAS